VKGRLRAVTALLATAIAMAAMVLAGCSAARPDVVRSPGPVGAAYWTRARLLGAVPLGSNGRLTPTPGASAQSHAVPTGLGLRVGALFEHSASGNHFCTASVVDSPAQDLLITAAHCIYNASSGGYVSDIVFIPDYRDGQEPYGAWTVARLLVSSQWRSSANPDYDFGFVVLNARAGQNIEQILGANKLGTDTQYEYLVHVTGYPDSGNSPISCVNWTSRQSDTQLRWECSGYTGGTSGSPWVAHFSTRSRTGTIVGVIGGYEEGGNTPSVSYSVRFGAAVQSLYQQAITTSSASPSPSPVSPSANAST
jgi:V8-like Glu-specific endopeptidase